jgi:E3 ubiquitin-protein ligase HERC4
VVFKGEEAIDAGGVRKEFFILLMRELLDPKYGMFYSYPETNVIWFSEASFEDDSMYFLVGVICGLAIYNFTIIDLPFPLAMYKKLLKEEVGLSDLTDLSPTLEK